MARQRASTSASFPRRQLSCSGPSFHVPPWCASSPRQSSSAPCFLAVKACRLSLAPRQSCDPPPGCGHDEAAGLAHRAAAPLLPTSTTAAATPNYYHHRRDRCRCRCFVVDGPVVAGAGGARTPHAARTRPRWRPRGGAAALRPGRGTGATRRAGRHWELIWSAKAEAFSPLLRLPRPLKPESYQLLGATRRPRPERPRGQSEGHSEGGG